MTEVVVEYLGLAAPRKMTASQKKYQDYLSKDLDMSFGEYIRIPKAASHV